MNPESPIPSGAGAEQGDREWLRDPDPDSPSQTYPDQQDPKGPQGLGQNSPSCYNSKSLLGPLIKLKPLYLRQGALECKMARWRGLAQKPSGPKQAPAA